MNKASEDEYVSLLSKVLLISLLSESLTNITILDFSQNKRLNLEELRRSKDRADRQYDDEWSDKASLQEAGSQGEPQSCKALQ